MWLCQQIIILKKCHFRANTGPAPCLQAQCNQNPSLLLLVGCWATTSWRNYHQAFSATTPIWDLHTILIYISSYFARFINYQRKLVKCIPKLMCSEVSVFKNNYQIDNLSNYQRKLVKCIPKFMCSEVSVFKNNFLSNRSLLYCIISWSKTALPSVAF